MILIGNVELIQFRTARTQTERNKYALEKGKKIQEYCMTQDELDTLESLRKEHKEVSKVLYQKLLIKEALCKGVNQGEFLMPIDFVEPLEEETKLWTRSFGYALSAKPNTIWVTGADGWQYESNDSPPPSTTEFTLLW